MNIRRIKIFAITAILLFLCLPEAKAQYVVPRERKFIDGVEHIACDVVDGDTMPLYTIRTVWVYRKMQFKNKKQEKFYWRLVRDVKVALPMVQYVREVIELTNDTLLTMKTKRERDKFMRGFEKRLYKDNEKRINRMTVRQGIIVMKLVDREMDESSFNLLKAYRGKFRAGFYQAIAKMCGTDLKVKFGEDEEDATIERIINLVESGML